MPRIFSKCNALLLSFLAVAAVYRVALALRFYGWEEDDYANLARSAAVAYNGLDCVPISHMPLYYLVNGGLIRVFGHAEIVCTGTSMVCGLAAMAFAMLVARKLGGARLEGLVGLILLVQPEFALYSSTSLREPMYAALGLAGLWLLVTQRRALAGLAMGGTLLVRPEAVLVFWPVFLVLAFPRERKQLWGFCAGLGCMLAVLLLWTLWVHAATGSWLYVSPQLAPNLATSGGTGIEHRSLERGLWVVYYLVSWLLPSRLGWPLLVAAALGLGLLARRWREPAALGVVMMLLLTLGFWLAMGLVFQHHPAHNLFWKWLVAPVPLLTLAGAVGLLAAADGLARLRWDRAMRLGVHRWAGPAVLALALVWFAVNAVEQTRAQIHRADELFLPQVELARHIERDLPPDEVIILDEIPANYLARQLHDYRILDWRDVEPHAGTYDRFEAVLLEHDVEYVLWFRSEWIRASSAAPVLGGLDRVVLDQLILDPLLREDRYGWVWYRVETRGSEPSI